ncbi:hypothetical protein [Enterobacter sp. PTB]|uniref:hypothetical protein n=1 Tax=Enterobacter sp. PTB TaxID=3143437 RepID=UPI003DA9C223
MRRATENSDSPRDAQVAAALKLYLELIERHPDELTPGDMQLIERLGVLICSFEVHRNSPAP